MPGSVPGTQLSPSLLIVLGILELPSRESVKSARESQSTKVELTHKENTFAWPNWWSIAESWNQPIYPMTDEWVKKYGVYIQQSATLYTKEGYI